MEKLCKNILLYMDEYSKVKWYKKKWKEIYISSSNSETCEKNSESTCYYYLKKNGMNYCYQLQDADNENVLEWIISIKDCEKIEKKVKCVKFKNSINLESMIYNLEKICRRNSQIEFEVYCEEYEEQLFLEKRIFEDRTITYAVIFIKMKGNEIDKILYCNELPQKKLEKQINECVRNYEKWTKYTTAEEIPFGKNVCVTTPEVSCMLFHEGIAHLAEADIYEDTTANPFIRLNQKIGMKELNIVDFPRHSKIKTNIFYDENGIRAKKLVVVNKGILKFLMSDEETRKTKQYMVYGFSRSCEDNNETQIRMRNIKVSDGKNKFDKIIKQVENGIFIEKADNAFRKDEKVYIHTQRAYVIRNGCLISRLQNVWLTNNTKEFLNDIYVIANNGKWRELSKCRKNEGTIYISGYAPSIGCIMNVEKTFDKSFSNKQKGDLL